MVFAPLRIEEREKLLNALRGNSQNGTALLMNRKDTSFIDSSEEIDDQEVVSAIKSVPVHY